jgi:hypothetical protein
MNFRTYPVVVEYESSYSYLPMIIQIDIARIQRAVELTDLAHLAERAHVPYTTLRSFAMRGWKYKHSDMLAKLARAADEILAEQDGSG